MRMHGRLPWLMTHNVDIDLMRQGMNVGLRLTRTSSVVHRQRVVSCGLCLTLPLTPPRILLRTSETVSLVEVHRKPVADFVPTWVQRVVVAVNLPSRLDAVASGCLPCCFA